MASKKSKKKVAKKTTKKVTRTPVKVGATKTPALATNAPARQPVHKKLEGRPAGSIAQQEAKLNALLHKVNNKHGGKEGAQVISKADEVSSNSYLRRPSGIMQLDLDTGGGMPAQSLVTIGGPPNAGKSTLMYHYFGMHQRLYGDASFIALANSEGGIDYIQARRCGWIVPVPMNVIEAMQQSRKDLRLPQLTKDEIAELRRSIGQNTIIEATTAEEILDVAEDLLRSNLYGFVGIDSYEGLIPGAEAALDSLEDHAQQALRANIITRFLQHYGAIKRDREHYTTLVMTTQVRTNRKKMELPGPMQKYVKDYSDDKSAWALQHWRAIHLNVDSGAKITANSTGKEAKNVLGKSFTWKVSKGKEGAHDNVHGDTPYYYDNRCFNTLTTVVLAGLHYGVIQERDGGLTFMRSNGEADEYLCRIPGKDSFIQAMLEEPDSEWDLRRAICMVAGVSPIYV